MKLKILITAIIIAFILIISVGCAAEKKGVQIDPNPDTESTQADYAVLYFGDSTGKYLVPEFRLVDVPANQSIEEFIVIELIKGPTSDLGDKRSVINPSCEVKSVQTSGDVLTITFDDEFLDWSFLGQDTETEVNRTKLLAVTSIVNSLVETTGYSQVQILVDKNNAGVGTRVLAEDVGISAAGDRILGPIGWDDEYVLDAENTLRVLMSALQKKDYDEAYSIIAYESNGETAKPSRSMFENELDNCPVIESFTIHGFSPNPQNQHCCVIVSYTLRELTGASITRSSVPAMLLRENDAWKMEYGEFLSLFVNAAEG